MNYDEATAYLYGLGNEVTTMKLGLENISKLLAALGDPQNDYLKVQIAGTNGKGSTCAFLDAICLSANIETGVYTSPHLVSINERIKINGAEISDKDFARHATRIRKTGEKLVETGELEFAPTFFEQMTAIALCAFRAAKIELAILETGLGGRFDATTAARAEIVAITPIDLDHQEILGDTLAAIASEKAAIIRPHVTAVIAPEQQEEALQVIRERCESVGVQPIFADFPIDSTAPDSYRKPLTATFHGDEIYQNVEIGLNGRHQLGNARVAVKLAEILRRKFQFNIGKTEIETGLRNAKHRGRLEFFHGILFDGAHNVAGAQSLKNYLDEFVSQPITLIFGAMRDKDLTEIARLIFPEAARLILTEPDNSRALSSEELKTFLPLDYDIGKVMTTDSVAEALNKAFNNASDNESIDENLIVITGSLYLVGEVQKLIYSQIYDLPPR